MTTAMRVSSRISAARPAKMLRVCEAASAKVHPRHLRSQAGNSSSMRSQVIELRGRLRSQTIVFGVVMGAAMVQVGPSLWHVVLHQPPQQAFLIGLIGVVMIAGILLMTYKMMGRLNPYFYVRGLVKQLAISYEHERILQQQIGKGASYNATLLQRNAIQAYDVLQPLAEDFLIEIRKNPDCLRSPRLRPVSQRKARHLADILFKLNRDRLLSDAECAEFKIRPITPSQS